MKEFNGTTYYTKADLQKQFGCSIGTINARICALKIQGYYICGHAKYFTTEQAQQIAEYRKPAGSNGTK